MIMISPVSAHYRVSPSRPVKSGTPIQFSSYHRSEPSSWGKHHWGEHNGYTYRLHIGDNSGWGSNVTGRFVGRQSQEVDLNVYQSDYGSTAEGIFGNNKNFKAVWYRGPYGTHIEKEHSFSADERAFITLLADELFPPNSK